jgi:hypothetical protein
MGCAWLPAALSTVDDGVSAGCPVRRAYMLSSCLAVATASLPASVVLVDVDDARPLAVPNSGLRTAGTIGACDDDDRP